MCLPLQKLQIDLDECFCLLRCRRDFSPHFEVLGHENGVVKELTQTRLAAAKGGATGIIIFVGDMDDDELKDDTCMSY